jgi:hypothetical protein
MVQFQGRILEMIARGFKPVAWVAAIGAAALGCYMLSLQVAAERADLVGIERRILLTQHEIRSLHTELGTRGRLQQLEQWNAEVLALSAPVAGQFLESNVSLARFDARHRGLEDGAEIRLASADAAPTPPSRSDVPALQLASATPAATPAIARPVAPLVRRASLVDAQAQPAAAHVAVAPRSTSLLDARTVADLRAESRSERDGGTRN